MIDSNDRLKKYLIENNKKVLFDELSDEYLKKAGVFDILKGIPIPLEIGAKGLSNLTIAFGMAKIIGADPEFKYIDNYIEYIRRSFGDVACRMMLAEGVRNAQEKEYETACMYFRAALLLEVDSQEALYLYARAARDVYLASELDDDKPERDEEYVGSFKAESMKAFELLTIKYPYFAMGYYYLGYAYLNMGLYTKAQLTWQEFTKLSDTADPSLTDEMKEEMSKAREEVSERLDSLEDPVKIEKGVNMVLSGDYLKGLEILKEYTDGQYSKWWPLWYYIGVANTTLGDTDEAIKAYKNALHFSPSNVEIMNELVEIYRAIGDAENEEKYLKKIEICKE